MSPQFIKSLILYLIVRNKDHHQLRKLSISDKAKYLVIDFNLNVLDYETNKKVKQDVSA